MDYEGINNLVRDAEESDWLDVSYSERKYVEEKPAKKKLKINLSKNVKIAIVAVLCVAVLAALLFIDGNFSKQVFETAKDAYASVLPAFAGKTDKTDSKKIEIPCNLTLVNVDKGVATFEGGRAALSFTSGKVTEVAENKVVIAIDEDTAISYENLKTVFVAVGDEVQANSLLGKYDGTFTATIVNNGEAVTDVLGSSDALTWNV